jgi:hypothetical protein
VGFSMPHHQFIKRMLTSLLFSSGTGSGSQATLLLDPITAKDLKEDEGFETKEKLSEWLMKNGSMPASLYWARRHDDLKKAKEGIEPFATWLKYPEDSFIPVSPFRAGMPIEIIVVGGETNAFMMAGDFRHASSASVDKWR